MDLDTALTQIPQDGIDSQTLVKDIRRDLHEVNWILSSNML
jgi:hypothetical protein